MRRSEPRAIWITLHRYIGLVTLLLLGFAALTGSILCFIRPLDVAMNGDLFTQRPSSSPIDVPVATDRFQAQHPELFVRSFPLSVAPDRTIPVKVEPVKNGTKLGFDQVFLDRTDGHLVGSRTDDAAFDRRGAMVLLHDVHYTLLAGDWGKWLMGGVAAAWLLSNLIGVYLTFPLRRPFWGNWRRMWRFSFRSATPRLLLDLHRSSGLWLVLPLTVLAGTSVALNFFTLLYVPAVERMIPPRISPLEGPAPFPRGVTGRLGFAEAVQRAASLARTDGSGWLPATALYQPKRKLYGITLTNDGVLNYRYLGPIYYYVDGDSGRLVHVDSPYRGNAGLALIRVLYPVHSGRTAGTIGVAIIFLLGLVTFGQCGTGLYVWWRKRRSRVLARQAAARKAVGSLPPGRTDEPEISGG